MGQTIVEKLAGRHLVQGPDRPLRPGDLVTLRPRHVLTHDNTAAVLAKFATLGTALVHDARQPVFALDHEIQNRSGANLAKYRRIEAFAREQGIDFHPAGEGIGHQLMMDEGYVAPGALVVASDSHANTYGALGALGTPVVRTDAAAIWATGEFWWQIPRTVRVVLEGALPRGTSGKDVILTLCGLYHDCEALNAAVEFTGPGVATLDIEARMTIANMTTEWGALTGWFPVDEVTLAYLRRRRYALAHRAPARITEGELDSWEQRPPRPDDDAVYAARIVLDLGAVTPRVAGPDSVQVVRPAADVARERIPVNKAYLLSCVNGRLGDLEAAARVLRGRRVAPGVELFVAAASREIQEEARASGAWQILLGAGARALPPGCGPCIGLGQGLLEPGEVGIAATNRNFKGRMGSREARTYLASPAVVAASAVAGVIDGPAFEATTEPGRRLTVLEATPPTEESVAIEAGFPPQLEGRVTFVPRDNLDTDGIYGKDYTYREDVTAELMARVVMANYDPLFGGKAQPGDVLVGGYNFGTGSSREQAVTALQAFGIAALVAGSFSQTYLRNAYNNGLLCIECPALVDHLREICGEALVDDEATIVPGGEVEIDFTRATLHFAGKALRFTPVGAVAQQLVLAGGIENLVRARVAEERRRLLADEGEGR